MARVKNVALGSQIGLTTNGAGATCTDAALHQLRPESRHGMASSLEAQQVPLLKSNARNKLEVELVKSNLYLSVKHKIGEKFG